MSEDSHVGVFCVSAEPEADRERLSRLRQRFGFVACTDAAPTDLRLVLTPWRLELRQAGPSAPGPIFVDFTGGALAHRRRFGGGRGQPLARAVGIRPGYSPTVADVTAGLGRDAFVLASVGCRMILCERAPVLAALLEDAFDRARSDPDVAQVVARMDLHWTDAREWLTGLRDPDRPDVIYLDPMYPTARSSALVKKEMRVVQRLVGPDVDSGTLLAAALDRARRRVVVKRPGAAAPLAGPEPSGCIRSKKTRYDIYVRI